MRMDRTVSLFQRSTGRTSGIAGGHYILLRQRRSKSFGYTSVQSTINKERADSWLIALRVFRFITCWNDRTRGKRRSVAQEFATAVIVSIVYRATVKVAQQWENWATTEAVQEKLVAAGDVQSFSAVQRPVRRLISHRPTLHRIPFRSK